MRHKPKKELKRTALKKSAPKKARKAPKKAVKKRTYTRRSKKGVKSLSPFEQAKKDLWDTFSKYIRLRDSDDEGYCTCITCPNRFFWKYGDAGHFVSRKEMATWLHEKNNHFQCKECNGKYEGRKYEYGKQIEKLYGVGTADYLIELSKTERKYSIPEMGELRRKYMKEVNQLKKEKKLR